MSAGYHVTKDTGTYADALLAYGAAKLLERLGTGEGPVILVDGGDRYELRCDSVRVPGGGGPLLLYDYVSLAAGDGACEAGAIINYAEERVARQTRPRRARLKRARAGQRSAVDGLPSDIADQVADAEAVRPEHRLIALVNSIDKSATVKRGNALRRIMVAADHGWIRDAVEALLTGWDTARPGLEELLGAKTLGLVLNPHAGKGINRPKPDGSSPDNLKGPVLEEWLKYAGLYEHAFVRAVSRGQDDRKFDVEVIVPIPEDIPLQAAREVMARLREAHLAGRGAPQVEILAVLEYARILAVHHRAAAVDRLLRRGRVNRIVAGVQVAYFQDLGGGKPVTALFRLGLPGFFDLQDRSDIDAYLEAVEEHSAQLRRLDATHSDHVGVLLRYREYLSSGHLRTFLEFLCEYGELVLKNQRRFRSLDCKSIERIVRGDTAMNMSDIVTNEGFRNVARAIRRSTVSEMFWKEVKHDQRYEIRYGLGHELRRLSWKPTQFLAALGEFAQSYNDENAKVRAGDKTLPPRRRRADITDADLDAVVRLVSEADDPEAVALLLVGYGYAREERDEELAAQTEEK